MRGTFTVDGDDGQAARGGDFEDRQIRQAVGADQQGFKDAAILQRHDDLIGIVDHMFVSNDVAAFIHNYPGAQSADLQLIMAGAVQPTVIDVNHRRGGAAYCLIVTGRRFICAVKLRRSQLIKLT
ncbi:hypothetical protein D3C76_1131110 [compost metagenome]